MHENSGVLEKTAEFVTELLTWVSGRGKIIIIVHDNPDPDCLASAVALRHLFVVALNRDAEIAFSGMIGRSENLAMAKALEITLTPLEILDLDDFQVVCLLDTQPETGNNSLPPGSRADIVIDHHPVRPQSRLCRFVDIREDYGVTATILYEYLVSQGISISTKLATALFYAIKSETQDLGREANRPDRDAYLKLFPLANKKLLYEITHPKLPIEYFRMLNTAIANTRIYGSAIVSNLMYVSFPEVVAEMADLFLRLEGAEACLCTGHYSDEIIISMRTLRHDLNLGEVIRRVVAGMGTAGGHGMSAGGKIPDVPAEDAAINRIDLTLSERFLAEIGKTNENPTTLLASAGLQSPKR